ncbi:MAG: peptidoglycan-associated lipoprotein Pal [Acidobacteriota bacterium]
MSRRTPTLRKSSVLVFAIAGGAMLLEACGGKESRPPATTAPAPAALPSVPSEAEPPEASPPAETTGDALTTLGGAEDILSRSLEEINAASPLTDIHFDYDSAALAQEARSRLDRHAQWLLRYPSVTILIEGHCDERGTLEYNLALGERRAAAAYSFLLNLGIPAERMKTISYGKEFPLDPGHNEAAWARNRRAHFEITSK